MKKYSKIFKEEIYIDKFMLSKILPEISPEELEDKIKIAWKKFDVNPNKPWGKCEQVVAYLWILLDKPQDLYPYDCEVGEEHHAVLYHKKNQIVLDPTSFQFLSKPIFLGWKEKTGYKRFTKTPLKHILFSINK